MKRVILTLALTSLTWSPILPAEENSETELANFRNVAKQLGGTLKSELMAAMKSEGPMAAIAICNEKAPEISAKISQEMKFKVARTSLKPRNADNAPDEWEKQVLMQFEERKAQGEDPKQLEFHAVVETEGQRQRRYMKAIPTTEECLTCHGTELIPEIKAKLEELYPDDKATGFKVGDLRGAFTFTETLAGSAK